MATANVKALKSIGTVACLSGTAFGIGGWTALSIGAIWSLWPVGLGFVLFVIGLITFVAGRLSE